MPVTWSNGQDGRNTRYLMCSCKNFTAINKRTFRDALQTDSGHYDCRAKNKAGQDSKVFHVNIQSPPSISGPSYLRKIAMQNSAVVMPCDASGIPYPVS